MTTAAVANAQPAQVEEQQVEEGADDASIVADLFPEMREPEPQKSGKGKPAPTEAEADDDAEDDQGEQEAEAEEQTDPFSLLRLDELFSEKALSTKQGIAKARETVMQARKAARELHHTANDAHVRAKRHEQAAKQRNNEANRAMRAAQALEARVQADIDTAFNSGDPEAVGSALGRLSKRDAAKLYEEWTSVLIGKKKADSAPKDPRLDAVLEKLSKLEKSKEEEQTAAQQRQHAEAKTRWLGSLDRDVAANTEQYRTIAHLLTLPGKPAELAEHVYELAQGHHEATGEWPSNAMLLQHVEKELRPIVRVPKAAPVAEPQTAAKGSGRLPGRSVSPTLGAQRSIAKGIDEMSQEEREEKMLEDADEILGGLGLT